MIAYGRNTVIEALKSNFPVHTVYLQEGIKQDPKISSLISLANSKGITIKYINHPALGKITQSQEHQGVACDIEFKEHKLKELLEKENLNSFIYISEATYEHNIGAIIRTAECAGLSGVIIPTDINITATIAKISTGALFHIPIIKLSIFQAIKEFHKEGFNIVGIERNGESFTKVNLPKNNLFIIGAEDKSLSDPVRKDCDVIVELPQFGHVNSLNMSVATGIIIYEYVRQNINELAPGT